MSDDNIMIQWLEEQENITNMIKLLSCKDRDENEIGRYWLASKAACFWDFTLFWLKQKMVVVTINTVSSLKAAKYENENDIVVFTISICISVLPYFYGKIPWYYTVFSGEKQRDPLQLWEPKTNRPET